MLTVLVLQHYLSQTSDQVPSAWNIIQTGGVIGVLFLGLYLILSGRLATRQQINELKDQLAAMMQDRDFWRGVALKGTDLTESHVKLTEEELPARMELFESEVTKRLSGIESALKARGGRTQ